MGMTKKIKMLLVEKEKTVAELAELIDTSQSNLSNKLRRDNFNEQDLINIAEALGAKYEANFVLDDGRKI